jgi:iron-sulfur cluster insertion protein
MGMLKEVKGIKLTENAKNRMRMLTQKRQNPNLMLRVNVTPSGCSGLTYQMSLDIKVNESDHLFKFDDVAVVIADEILKDIDGSIIDFEETLLSSQFVVNNPLATKTCNCGLSFQTATNKGHIKRCN